MRRVESRVPAPSQAARIILGTFVLSAGYYDAT
jgi:hypothetical protein